MSPWFSRAKSALLHSFAGQRAKSPAFCGAKNKGPVNWRGKICIAPWFCGAKSTLLHNFAGKDIVFRAKIKQKNTHLYSLTNILASYNNFKYLSTIVTIFYEKKIFCRTVPLRIIGIMKKRFRCMHSPSFELGSWKMVYWRTSD